MPLPRNPVVRAGAILRKGGAHSKSVSGQRQRRKLDLRDEIDDWFDDADDAIDLPTQRIAEGGQEPPSGSDCPDAAVWLQIDRQPIGIQQCRV